MWWRTGIAIIVILVLTSATYKYFWRFPLLVRFYKFLAFKDKDALAPTQQGVHFFLGMVSLPAFRLIADFFHFSPIITADIWYVIAALIGALLKEGTDIIVNNCWHKRDSIVDISFWLLGGLTAPLLKTCFYL